MSADKEIAGHKLTADERHGYTYDLTHGHAYRRPFEQERYAIGRIRAEMLSSVDMRGVKRAESEFVQSFMDMSRQEPQPGEGHFIYPSASQSLLAAASILRSGTEPKSEGKHVAEFVPPIFDNIHGLFKLQGFDTRFTDVHGADEKVENADVLILVTPNNPTGFRITPEVLDEVAKKCQAARTALCIDRTFLNQPEDYAYDMHKILADSGVSYITIDDTGKLWPTQEIKLSILTTSPDMRKIGENIHDLLQLSASPAAMRAFAELARDGGALPEIRELTKRNMHVLRAAAAGTGVFVPLDEQDAPSELTIDRLKIGDYPIDKVIRALGNRGVGVLDTNDFIPDNTLQKSEPYIRVSVARDPEYIDKAAYMMSGLSVDEIEGMK